MLWLYMLLAHMVTVPQVLPLPQGEQGGGVHASDDDDVATLVKSYINSGTCDSVDAGTSCGDSADSYYWLRMTLRMMLRVMLRLTLRRTLRITLRMTLRISPRESSSESMLIR